MMPILQVASEDAVLYTAQAYADRLAADALDPQSAVSKLAPLVRCPHLSQFWLSASVLSDDADRRLLRALQPQLKRLLLLQPACGTYPGRNVADIPGVPASWLLPVRDIQPVSKAQVSWQLDVEAIKRAARSSASQRQKTILRSPTSLLGGVLWGIQLECVWDSSKQGSRIRVATRAESISAGTFCRCTHRLECVNWPHAPGIPRFSQGTLFYDGLAKDAWGGDDFFDLGSMSDGFDDAAWAAKRLPGSHV
jgi:hypothetical protein